jgi:hypothetical protein
MDRNSIISQVKESINTNVNYLIELYKKDKRFRYLFYSFVVLVFLVLFFRSFLVIGIIILVEVISCYYLRQIPVKGWLELLSFLIIICAKVYGVKFGFWLFIVAYVLSMIGRQAFYPVEIPYMFARAFTLAWVPVIMSEANLMFMTLITMLVQRAVLYPVLRYFSGVQPFRLFYETVLNIAVTVAVMGSIGNLVLSLL